MNTIKNLLDLDEKRTLKDMFEAPYFGNTANAALMCNHAVLIAGDLPTEDAQYIATACNVAPRLARALLIAEEALLSGKAATHPIMKEHTKILDALAEIAKLTHNHD